MSGPIVPPPPQTPVSFTPDQISVLKAQIYAFKCLSRGTPVPDNVQQAIQFPNNAVAELDKSLQGADVASRIVDSAVKVQKGTSVEPTAYLSPAVKAEDASGDPSKARFLPEESNSSIYPYNAFRHPFSHLKRNTDMDPTLFATRLQRLLVPTLMPGGLDAHQILNERDRYVEARINQRIRELEDLPSTIGDGGFDSVSHSGDKENQNAKKEGDQDDGWGRLLLVLRPEGSSVRS